MSIDFRLGPLGQATLQQAAKDLPGQVIAPVGVAQYLGNIAEGIAADRSIHDFEQATGYTARDPQEARRAGVDQPLREAMSNLHSSEEIGRAHQGFEDVIEGRNTPETLAAVASDPIRAEGARAGLDVAQMNGPGGLDTAEANGAWASVAQDRQTELREAEQGPVNPAVEQAEARDQMQAEAASTPDIWEETSRFDDLTTETGTPVPESVPERAPDLGSAPMPEAAPEPGTAVANEPAAAAAPAPESEAAPSLSAAAPEVPGPPPELAVAQPEVEPSGAEAQAPEPESAAPGVQTTAAEGPEPELGPTPAAEASAPEPEAPAAEPAPEPPAPAPEPTPAPEAAHEPEAGL